MVTMQIKFDTLEQANCFLDQSQSFMEQHIDWEEEGLDDPPCPYYDMEKFIVDFREKMRNEKNNYKRKKK